MLNVSSYTLTDPGARRNLKPTPMSYPLSNFNLVKNETLLVLDRYELDADHNVTILEPVFIGCPQLIAQWKQLKGLA